MLHTPQYVAPLSLGRWASYDPVTNAISIRGPTDGATIAYPPVPREFGVPGVLSGTPHSPILVVLCPGGVALLYDADGPPTTPPKRVRTSGDVMDVAWGEGSDLTLLLSTNAVAVYDVSAGWALQRLVPLAVVAEAGVGMCLRYQSTLTVLVGTSVGGIDAYSIEEDGSRGGRTNRRVLSLMGLCIAALEVVATDPATGLVTLLMACTSGAVVTALYLPSSGQASIHCTLKVAGPSRALRTSHDAVNNVTALRCGGTVALVLHARRSGGGWAVLGGPTKSLGAVPPPCTVLRWPTGVVKAPLVAVWMEHPHGVRLLYGDSTTASHDPAALLSWGPVGVEEDHPLYALGASLKKVAEAAELCAVTASGGLSTLSRDEQLRDMCALVETRVLPLAATLDRARRCATSAAEALVARQAAMAQREAAVHRRAADVERALSAVAQILTRVDDAVVAVALVQGHGGDPRAAAGPRAGGQLKRVDPTDAVAFVLSSSHTLLSQDAS